MLQSCQTGTTTGFPINLSQSLYSDWPATANSQQKLQNLLAPTDFTVQWGPPAQGAQISVRQTATLFQIRGFNTVSDSTTLTYGAATYRCSDVISVVQNQHRNLSNNNASYEIILAFQIKNKSLNPSSPDVILMCRPLVFSESQTTPFWSAVNSAVKSGTPQSCVFDMSSLYGYNQSVLIPMLTYQTCLPVKLLNYKNNVSSTGSISVRVHVANQPMYIMADPGGTGLCSSVNKYTLALPGRAADLFEGAAADTKFQFQDGLGSDRFPSGALDNLVPLATNTVISAFQIVLQTFTFLVPEEFLGKSLAEIAATETHTPVPQKKKAFKCYKIDPEKDIHNDQILIDPTTGESLSDTMRQKAYDDSGGDPAFLDLSINGPDTSGVMPGDVQHIMFIVFTSIGSIFLLAYLMFIVHTLVYRENGFHDAVYHIVLFVILLIGLVLFGVYFGEGS